MNLRRPAGPSHETGCNVVRHTRADWTQHMHALTTVFSVCTAEHSYSRSPTTKQLRWNGSARATTSRTVSCCRHVQVPRGLRSPIPLPVRAFRLHSGRSHASTDFIGKRHRRRRRRQSRRCFRGQGER